MDMIQIAERQLAYEGLELMLTAAIGGHDYSKGWVPFEIACMVEQLARAAEDRDEWFPLGKWATIQALQGRIDAEIKKLTWKGEE